MDRRLNRIINLLFVIAFIADAAVACCSASMPPTIAVASTVTLTIVPSATPAFTATPVAMPSATADVFEAVPEGASEVAPAVMPSATAADPADGTANPGASSSGASSRVVYVPDDAQPEEVFELGYWPAQRMWLLLRNDNGVIGIPEGQEGNPDTWLVLHRGGMPTQSAAVRAAQLSDGRLAVAMLGVRAERIGEGNGIGVLDDSWRFIPAPDGVDDVMGLAPLPNNLLLVAFASSLWTLDVDTDGGSLPQWKPFDSLPDGFAGPVYEAATMGEYLYLSGPEAGIWLKAEGQWTQIVKGGTGNTNQGHLYVSHIETVDDRDGKPQRLYFVQNGKLHDSSPDGYTIKEMDLALPGDGDWVRLMAASESGFLYQVVVDSIPRIYHRNSEGVTTLVLGDPETSSAQKRAFGLAKPALWTAWPVPGSWCDPGFWASEPKTSGDAIEYIIETVPRVTWLYQHKKDTFETSSLGGSAKITAGSVASQGSQCGSKQLFVILDVPGWDVPANNYCGMWESALDNGKAWRTKVNLTYNPPSLSLNSVSPGAGPLAENTNITIAAFGRDDHRIYQPNWSPGWDHLELRYYINAATDGTSSGSWWEFGRVSGAGRGWGANSAGEAMGEPAIAKNGALNWAAAPAWMPRTGRHLVAVNLYAIDAGGGEHVAAIWSDAPTSRSAVVEWAAATATPTATSTATPMSTATNTPMPTSTATPTATSIATATSTPTPTSTATNTPTPTSTATPTATSVATATPTPTSTATPLPAWSGDSVEIGGLPISGAIIDLRGRYNDCSGGTGDVPIASALTAADGSFSISAAVPSAPGCGWQNIAIILSLPWNSVYRPFSVSAPAPGSVFSSSEIRYPASTTTGSHSGIRFVVELIPVSVGTSTDYPYLVLRGPEIPPPSGPLPAQVLRGSYSGPLPLNGREVTIHIWNGSVWIDYKVFTNAAGNWLLTPAFAGDPLLGTTLLGSWQAYAEITISGSGVYVSPDVFWSVRWFPVHGTK